MDKLAAIHQAVEEVNKEAMFGGVLAAGRRFAGKIFSRAPKVTGAGAAAASASAPKVALPGGPMSGLARFPNSWKGMGATMAVGAAPPVAGAVSGPTKF